MMTVSIAKQQALEFIDLNPPDSDDKPRNVKELCAVKSRKSLFYTAVVVTDKTGVKSVFQLMQVNLVSLDKFLKGACFLLSQCEFYGMSTRRLFHFCSAHEPAQAFFFSAKNSS